MNGLRTIASVPALHFVHELRAAVMAKESRSMQQKGQPRLYLLLCSSITAAAAALRRMYSSAPVGRELVSEAHKIKNVKALNCFLLCRGHLRSANVPSLPLGGTSVSPVAEDWSNTSTPQHLVDISAPRYLWQKRKDHRIPSFSVSRPFFPFGILPLPCGPPRSQSRPWSTRAMRLGRSPVVERREGVKKGGGGGGSGVQNELGGCKTRANERR